MHLIWVRRERKYFCKWGWTGSLAKHEVICPSGRFAGRFRHCEEPTGPAFGGPDDKLRDEAIQTSSFRGDAKHRTRNLEIPGLVLMHHRSEERRVGKECKGRWS